MSSPSSTTAFLGFKAASAYAMPPLPRSSVPDALTLMIFSLKGAPLSSRASSRHEHKAALRPRHSSVALPFRRLRDYALAGCRRCRLIRFGDYATRDAFDGLCGRWSIARR